MQISQVLLGRWPATTLMSRLPATHPALRWAWAPALLVVLALIYWAFQGSGETTRAAAANARDAQAASTMAAAASVPLTDPQDLMPLAPQDALAINAARPVSTAVVQAAAPLIVSATQSGLRDTALQCLTSALYYEAASEGDDGMRAVAQVILNRVRHPAYPSSVCGVVYQGSTRATGCQFTFTCDGSLARTPSTSGWARSRRIAEAALSGRVFAPVGHSTHYHADYVVPYWASSLNKVNTIGRHIFYSWMGRAGTRAAFRQRYAGVEQLPGPVAVVAETAVVAPPTTSALPVVEQPLTADTATALKTAEQASTLKADRAARRPLLADLEAGKLVATPVRSAQRSAPSPLASSDLQLCERAQPAAPVQPIGGNSSGAREAAGLCS